MARLVVLDDLSLFSALVVKKVGSSNTRSTLIKTKAMLNPLPLPILQLTDDARQGNVASRQAIQQRFVHVHTSNCTEICDQSNVY